MPRRSKRKLEEEDEWTPDGVEQADDSSEPEPDDSEPEADPDYQQSDSNAVSTTGETSGPIAPLSKPKRRRKKVFVIDEEEEAKPTYTRKTEKGGYAHTNRSKSRISAANKGNTPWNFGKRRSSADKAKIAAGVRARNRAILLQKLKHLGMTEEEYNQKKKEIKYLRERVRRAKLANRKRDKLMETKLQAAIDATNVKNIKIDPAAVAEEQKKEEEKMQAAKAAKAKVERTAGIFWKEITWRPSSSPNSDITYDKSCPTGGPGGLICCEACSIKYNTLLTRTSEDVETFRMIKESGEVTEIIGFLGQKKTDLKDAFNAAKKKVPPLPAAGSGRLALRQNSQAGNSSRKTATSNNYSEPPEYSGNWNLTSAIGLGTIGGFASV